MKLTTKQILIIAAIVLVVFVVVGIWFYRKGKRQVTIQAPPLDNPDTGTGNNTYSVSNAEILQTVEDLYRDMNGFNWAGHDAEPYEKLQSFSDTDFVNTYNTFNSKYQQESQQTLKEWIESESYAFDDIVDSILDRMDRLNLK